MRKKTVMAVPSAGFWAVIAVCVIGIVIGSFLDFQISEALADKTEIGAFFAAYGSYFSYCLYPAAGACLFVGMLITLDREVYDERMAYAAEDGNRKEADGGVYYTRDGEKTFIASVSDAVFVQITAYGKTNLETVVARFSLALDR